jgi:hypothetical protein
MLKKYGMADMFSYDDFSSIEDLKRTIKNNHRSKKETKKAKRRKREEKDEQLTADIISALQLLNVMPNNDYDYNYNNNNRTQRMAILPPKVEVVGVGVGVGIDKEKEKEKEKPSKVEQEIVDQFAVLMNDLNLPNFVISIYGPKLQEVDNKIRSAGSRLPKKEFYMSMLINFVNTATANQQSFDVKLGAFKEKFKGKVDLWNSCAVKEQEYYVKDRMSRIDAALKQVGFIDLPALEQALNDTQLSAILDKCEATVEPARVRAAQNKNIQDLKIKLDYCINDVNVSDEIRACRQNYHAAKLQELNQRMDAMLQFAPPTSIVNKQAVQALEKDINTFIDQVEKHCNKNFLGKSASNFVSFLTSRPVKYIGSAAGIAMAAYAGHAAGLETTLLGYMGRGGKTSKRRQRI